METKTDHYKDTFRIMDHGFNHGHLEQAGSGSERRRSIRFPLQMLVSYRAGARASNWLSGKTVNISSTGMLIHPADALAQGSKVHMLVDWPRMLDDRIPLRLMVQGHVVRSSGEQAAIRFDRFEFRTAKEPMGKEPAPALPGGSF